MSLNKGTSLERFGKAELLINAEILLQAKDYRLAKSVYRHLIENGFELARCYRGLAEIYLAEGKKELAEKSLRESIIYDPRYSSLVELANIYLLQEKINDTIKCYLRAKNIPELDNEKLFLIHTQLGNCYLRDNDEGNAEIHYRKAYELNPNDYNLHISIAALALKKGNVEPALLHYKQAAKLNNKSSDAYTGMALCHINKNDHLSAFNDLRTALDLDRDNLNALFNIVKIAYKTQSFAETERYLIEYIKANPININVLYSLAGIYFHQEKMSNAEITCRQILHVRPEFQPAIDLMKKINPDRDEK